MMLLQAQREWHNIFQVMTGKNLRPRILYSARFHSAPPNQLYMNAKRISLDKKERLHLETRKLQMRKLTSKGKYTVKGRKSSTHKYDIKLSNHEKRRVRMQDIRNTFEIKRPALRTIVWGCVCVCVQKERERKTERARYIKTSW